MPYAVHTYFLQIMLTLQNNLSAVPRMNKHTSFRYVDFDRERYEVAKS